jgi:hypothetical protein
MKIAFTPIVANRMINRAKRTFINYPHKSVSPNWKKALAALQVFIVINLKLKTTAGCATFMRQRAAKKVFQIPDELRPTLVDNVLGYFIMEINPKLIVANSPKEVYDTVSHELAHCLDFKLRGYYNKDDNDFHDAFWSFLHKRMGGNGKRYIEPTFIFPLVNREAGRAKKIQEDFKPIDNKGL